MKINKRSALSLWEERYGDQQFAEDFHGNLMCKNGYGNGNFYILHHGRKIYCGWNIHHILPIACGGTNAKRNLICTNIETNREAGNRITYWIDDCLYQVQRIRGAEDYDIYKIKGGNPQGFFHAISPD